jgi:hypothetical protein
MKRRARPIAAFPFDKAIAQAQAVIDLLEPFKLDLTMKDRNRRLKLPSKNFGAIAHLLYLAKEHGLDAYAAPIEEHAGPLEKLAKLRAILNIAADQTSELIMSSETETWQATTIVYTSLRRIARSDGDLAANLTPIVQKYFARKRSAGADATASTPEAAPAIKRSKKKKRGA